MFCQNGKGNRTESKAEIKMGRGYPEWKSGGEAHDGKKKKSSLLYWGRRNPIVPSKLPQKESGDARFREQQELGCSGGEGPGMGKGSTEDKHLREKTNRRIQDGNRRERGTRAEI